MSHSTVFTWNVKSHNLTFNLQQQPCNCEATTLDENRSSIFGAPPASLWNMKNNVFSNNHRSNPSRTINIQNLLHSIHHIFLSSGFPSKTTLDQQGFSWLHCKKTEKLNADVWEAGCNMILFYNLLCCKITLTSALIIRENQLWQPQHCFCELTIEVGSLGSFVLQ